MVEGLSPSNEVRAMGKDGSTHVFRVAYGAFWQESIVRRGIQRILEGVPPLVFISGYVNAGLCITFS